MTALAVSNIVLWIVVSVLLVVVLALVRQMGVLHERVSPVGALMLTKGLAVGEPAPSVDVEDLAGAPLRIGSRRADGKSSLVMFVSPSCPLCKAFLPVLKSYRHAAESSLDIVLASDGDLPAQREFVRRESLDAFRYVVSSVLGVTYQIGRLPYAILIDSTGILRARGLVNSREHLESLFEAQRLGVASLQAYLEGRGARVGHEPTHEA